MTFSDMGESKQKKQNAKFYTQQFKPKKKKKRKVKRLEGKPKQQQQLTLIDGNKYLFSSLQFMLSLYTYTKLSTMSMCHFHNQKRNHYFKRKISGINLDFTWQKTSEETILVNCFVIFFKAEFHSSIQTQAPK